MKVSKILCIIIILIQFIIIIAFTTNKNTSSKNVFEETKETTKKNAGTLSFMLETSYGSGKYEKGSSTKWPLPSDGYIFNDTLSKCENGGELMWDDTKNVVLMTGNISDKCCVYFDMIKLITFYIDDIEYKAVENMTWKEWVESNYCTIEISTSSVCTGNNNLGLGNQKYIFNSTGTYDLALTGDKIIENNKYLIRIYNEPCKVA